MHASNRISILSLAGLVLTLAFANVIAWGIRFHEVPAAALLICTAAFCSEILCANLALEFERNIAAKHRAKALVNVLLALVLGAFNVAGTHNAWVMAEEAVLARPRAEAQAAWKSERDRRAAAVQLWSSKLEVLVPPDPLRVSKAKYRLAVETYDNQVQLIKTQVQITQTQLDEWPKAPTMPTLAPDWAVKWLLVFVEIVKFIGFWSLSAVGFRLTLSASEAGRALRGARKRR